MAERNYKWYKLDNAATIIPSTASGSDTRVFRIVCELKEEVNGVVLQEALDHAIEEFPHFNVVLKKGFFWYYLDSTRIRPVVMPDETYECAPLYYPGRHKLLYRVTYFKRRINLEMFHVLADGTGAFAFIRTIVAYYLQLIHGMEMDNGLFFKSTAKEKSDDAFKLFFEKDDSGAMTKNLKFKKAYVIKQDRDENLRNHLIEGTVPADAFMKIAKSHGTTAGILSVALMIESIIETMRKEDAKLPVVITVPVNLRQFFNSQTTRNFFGVINVSFFMEDYDGSIESIIVGVKKSFEEGLAPESIKRTMNGFSSLERNFILKMVPLFIKEPVIQWFNYRAKNGVTATVSNLGRIDMPPQLAEYVESFSAYMTSRSIQICIATYQNKMIFGAVSAFPEQTVLVNFFRKLADYGMEVVVGSNDYDYVEE